MDIDKVDAAERRGTNSTKWDGTSAKFGADDLLPMWIADMDFPAPGCVHEALKKIIDFGVYGYSFVDDGYYQSFIDWEKKKHGYEVKKEWLRYTPGVVSGLYWFINAMTLPGEACMILTPCYYPFMDAVRNTGRKLICCDLVNTGGHYTVDLKKFEDTIRVNHVKLFLLCSPHNPVGRVWSRTELNGILDICKHRGVFVVSDEIHQDITFGGHRHIPAAAAGDYDDMLATLTSASKTFNLAGCKNSFAVIPDREIRERFDRYAKSIRVTRGSVFGYVAVEAAYRNGEPWLERVLNIIAENYRYLRDTLMREFPGITVSPLEGTYLVWIDLGAYVPCEQLYDFIQNRCGLALDYGEWFYENRADTHVRMNLATSAKNVGMAVSSLIREIRKLPPS